jgi:ribosomal protein S30
MEKYKMVKEEQQKEDKKVNRGREQKSGHGSLTKSGKVRSQTPKIVKTNLRKHHGPLVKNRIRYAKSLKPKESNTRNEYRM